MQLFDLSLPVYIKEFEKIIKIFIFKKPYENLMKIFNWSFLLMFSFNKKKYWNNSLKCKDLNRVHLSSPRDIPRVHISTIQ